MTDDQARTLWDVARSVGDSGSIVEIGSFRGRSTIVLARAAADDVTVTAIDPHAGSDRGPQEIAPDATTGEADHEVFLANLERAGVSAKVRPVRKFSSDALGDVTGDIDLLYVDGAHRYEPARDDLEQWGTRVRPGGTMLVHDAFSSVGVTLRAGARPLPRHRVPLRRPHRVARRVPPRSGTGPGSDRERGPPGRVVAVVRAQRAGEARARLRVPLVRAAARPPRRHVPVLGEGGDPVSQRDLRGPPRWGRTG